MSSLTDAFQNLYTYIISIAGVIALAALIIGGILYLTSAGDPEKLTKARKQILAAFFGIIILLSSYLILRTINPDLVSFEMPKLEQIIFHPLDMPPSETKVPTLLERVKEIVNFTKKASEGIENSAQAIQQLSDQCSCENTQPLCYCSGGEDEDSCEPHGCYAGPGFQPCPNQSEIKENQKRVIAWKDEILYYRNRALAEKQDLQDEIKKVLDEEIVYYQKRIIIEEDEKVIEDLTERKEEITVEKNLKKDLAAKLKELADKIKEIEPFMSEIGTLPDKCLINVKDKCDASCEGDCHDVDVKDSCKPTDCSGGNPCPIDDIQNQFSEIQQLKPSIIQACNEILNIIDDIIKHKTIII